MSQNAQNLLLFFSESEQLKVAECVLNALEAEDQESIEHHAAAVGDELGPLLIACWQDEWCNCSYVRHSDHLVLNYDSRSSVGVPLPLLHAWFNAGLSAAVVEIFFDQVGEQKRYHFVDDALVSKDKLERAYPQWVESIGRTLPLQDDEENEGYCVAPSSPVSLQSLIAQEQEREEKAQALLREITNFTSLAAETGTPALSLMKSALLIRCLLKGVLQALLFSLIMILLFKGVWLWIVLGIVLLVALPLFYAWRMLKSLSGEEVVSDAD